MCPSETQWMNELTLLSCVGGPVGDPVVFESAAPIITWHGNTWFHHHNHLFMKPCWCRLNMTEPTERVWTSQTRVWGQTRRSEVDLLTMTSLFYSLFTTDFIPFDQRRSRISRALRVCHVQSLKTRHHLNNRSLRPGTVPVLDQTKGSSVAGVTPCRYGRGALAVVVLSISISTWIWGLFVNL